MKPKTNTEHLANGIIKDLMSLASLAAFIGAAAMMINIATGV